jgi:hypothetical protein
MIVSVVYKLISFIKFYTKNILLKTMGENLNIINFTLLFIMVKNCDLKLKIFLFSHSNLVAFFYMVKYFCLMIHQKNFLSFIYPM